MRYHNITKDDMLNGDGLRVVLWVSGCSHCCKGCQNPITWDVNGGVVFDESAKQEIFDQLDKPYISGITFSVGDPLHSANRMDVRTLMAEIREKYPNKTIWLYTGGTWEVTFNLSNDVVTQLEGLISAYQGLPSGQKMWFEVWSPYMEKAFFVIAQVPANIPMPEFAQNELQTVAMTLTIEEYKGMDTGIEPTETVGP